MSDTTTITPIEASNSLADLAARIKIEHTAVSDLFRQSVGHGIAAGVLLREAKISPASSMAALAARSLFDVRENEPTLHAAGEEPGGDRKAQRRCGFDPERGGCDARPVEQCAKAVRVHAGKLERTSGPEETMQLCLDSGVATYAGIIDYEFSYGVEQRRQWDLYLLFMVRHIRWPAEYADSNVCWLKRCGYKSPSEWMGKEGDEHRRRQLCGESHNRRSKAMLERLTRRNRRPRPARHRKAHR